MMKLLYIIPKNYLSYFLGRLASVKLPKPFSTMLVKAFASYYKIDVSNISKSLDEYTSIGDFFIRDLKNYPETVPSGILSPVEGTLRSFGEIRQNKIIQVKGIEYSVTDLLGDTKEALRFENGCYLNFYLSPQDYHQVHAPVSGMISGSTYIKGKLWPVNDWSLHNIKGLFAVNERLVTYLDSEYGRIALVMVGATNVGKITVSYDDWVTNDLFENVNQKKINSRIYEQPLNINRGAKLGVFHMGSAVVMLIEKKVNFTPQLMGQKVQLLSHLSEA